MTAALGCRLSALGLLLASVASATDLNPAQRDLVDRGELAIVQHDRLGSAWPAMTIFAFIDATPEEAAAVFTDYEEQATYIPSVTKSHVSRVLDAATSEVDYAVEVPLFPDEEYTVRDHITLDSVGVYRVDWTLVRAVSTKGTVGHAQFSRYTNRRTGRVGTLLEYHNFVTPGSRLAGVGFVRTRAIRQMSLTVQAVARHVESEREKPEMVRRLTTLRAAVRH